MISNPAMAVGLSFVNACKKKVAAATFVLVVLG
jgi:hypothetical protein